jgi:hypothetical protein
MKPGTVTAKCDQVSDGSVVVVKLLVRLSHLVYLCVRFEALPATILILEYSSRRVVTQWILNHAS